MLHRQRHASRIIAGVEQAAGRGAKRKYAGRHEIAPDHVERIELQFDRDALHQPFERVVNLRAAEAAIEPGRRLVGQHHAVAHRHVADVVGAGEIAVHAIERGGLGRADMRADVLDLVPGERGDAAVRLDRRFQRDQAVGRRHRGGEMLEPVLDPFHRAAGDARRDPHQRDVGEDALLHAETAAGIGRHAQPQPVARHFQRARQHRVDAERPLEGRQDIVGVLARIVVGDQPVGLDRRAGIARIVDRHRDAMRRAHANAASGSP